jgi:hypothetical protein
MTKALGSILILLGLFFCCVFVVDVHSAVLFQDDFESYDLNTFPSPGGWTIIYNGAGDSYQHVDNATAVSGTKSFHSVGSDCWASTNFRAVDIPDKVTFEVNVRIDQVVSCGCGPDLAHMGLYGPGGSWGSYWRAFFRCDGNIYAEGYAPPLQSYSAGTWYHVMLNYDLTLRVFDVYVDGILRASGLPMVDAGTPTGVVIGAHHGANPVAWFDDVKVSERSCVPPPSNLVSWWSGDGHPFDLTGVNDGITVNGATYGDGMVGKAFSFDGEDDYLFVPNTATIDGGAEATYMAWVYPAAAPAIDTYTGLVGAGDSTQPVWTTQQCRLLYWRTAASPPDAAKFYIDCGTNDVEASYAGRFSAQDYSIGAWHLVTGVFNNGSLDIYVNGILDNGSATGVNPGTFINTSADNIVWVGALVRSNQTAAFQHFNGLIDEVQILDRALAAQEIATIYNAGNAGICKPCSESPSGLVAWWKGDDDADDVIGTNHGTLFNGATFTEGMVGRAFSLDGADDYVDLPDAVSNLLSDSAGSLSAWIYPASVGDNDIVVAFGSGNDGQGIGLGVLNAVRIYHHTGAYDWQSSTPVSANEWTLLTYTWDATTETIYKNGVYSENRTRNFSYVPGHGRIGHGFWGDGANAFPERIDEVAVFSRVLSAEEIARIYAARNAGVCIPPDTTPEPFSFNDLTDAALSTVFESNSITVAGINSAATISISGGDYSIGGGDYTSSEGTVTGGQTVRVRQISSSSYSTTTDATLTIGGVSDTFSVTTIPIPTYTVATSVPGGHGTLVCTSPVNQGESSTCTITPDTDYHLATLTDNGTPVIGSVSNGQYVISNVTADHEVIGTFSIHTFYLSITLQGTGTGTVTSDPAAINCGLTCGTLFSADTLVTLTATPAIGSFFAGWGGDCNADGEVTITAGKSCTATFTAYTELQVQAPNGGEDLMAGQSCTIRWGAPASMEAFNILYSLDGGQTWKKEATKTAGNSYPWTVPVPAGSANKKKCLVKVIGYNGQGVKVATDTSAQSFVINHVRLDSHNGGQLLDAGGTETVTWTTREGLAATTAKVYYSIDKGMTWIYSGQTSAGAGSYAWQVPSIKKPKSTCRVKVTLFNGSTRVGSDKSDGNFTVRTVEVVDPNGSETLTSGQGYDVSYHVYTRYAYAQAEVYLSLDGGVTWKLLGQQDPVAAPGPASLAITLPGVTTTKKNCKLKVQLVDEESKMMTNDTSNAAFTISTR